MKLYDLDSGDHFRLIEDTNAPPDIGKYHAGRVLRLGNIDGMYSYCIDIDTKEVCHPVAWAEVEKVPA
jgi:hypothetical protein